jgi:hypothetical protein
MLRLPIESGLEEKISETASYSVQIIDNQTYTCTPVLDLTHSSTSVINSDSVS